MDQVSTPVAPWLLEYGGLLGLAVVVLLLLREGARERTLTTTALIVLGGTAIWWQEWWLDYAYYLLWSPEFDFQLSGDWTTWTTPNKPWLLVLCGYGYYWAAVFLGTRRIVLAVRRRRPEWSPMRSYLPASIPTAYVINMLFEGFCTQMGWWSYTEAAPPVINFGEGQFSLTSPIAFMMLFPVVMGAVLDRRDAHGRFAFETRLGIAGESALAHAKRLVAIVLLMNVVYFVTGIAPGLLIRWLGGPESTLVP